MTREDEQVKRRPRGRTLAEFINERPLSKAEKLVLESVAKGEEAEISPEPGPDQCLRPGLLRFLALGGDETAPIHEHGIRIKGGWIEGDLDLENARVPVELTLLSCKIEGALILSDAELFGLNLSGSCVNEVSAPRIRTKIVVLGEKFHAKGQVDLQNAHVAGNVQCTGGKFESGSAGALLLDSAEVKGSVYFDRGFSANGAVQLSTSKIDGNLVCTGGHFEGANVKAPDGTERRGPALLCDQATVGASVWLTSLPNSTGKDDCFSALGSVSANGARVGGDIVCTGNFNGGKDGALSLRGTEVKGRVYLRGSFSANGIVDLDGIDMSGDLNCEGGAFEGWTETRPNGPTQRWIALRCNQSRLEVVSY